MKGTHINTLIKMTIRQINDSENARIKSNNEWESVNERQRETIASYIEQEEIKEDWAEKFLEDMKI